MKKLLIISTLIILISQSCRNESIPALRITYDGISYIKLVASNVIDSIYVETNFVSYFPIRQCETKRIIIQKDGIYFLQYKITKPELVEFIIGDSFKSYIFPNDTMIIQLNQISIDSIHNLTNYISNNKIFNYCQAKLKEIGYVAFIDKKNPAFKYWTKWDNSKDEIEKALKLLELEEQRNISFLNRFKKELPGWFVTLESCNVRYSSAAIKIHFTSDPKDPYPKDKLKLNLPISNPDAKFAAFYYFFLESYFFQEIQPDKHLHKIAWEIDILKKELLPINSFLKGDIRSYFVTGKISTLYYLSDNAQETALTDSLINSYDLGLNSKQIQYLEEIKKDNQNRQIIMTSLKSRDKAPDFKLKDNNGTRHSLAEFSGKNILLHFWATWCGPCISEIPELNKLTATWDKTKIVKINICLDNDTIKWRKIITDYQLDGLNLICDSNWENLLSVAYRIYQIPHYTLIDTIGLISRNNYRGLDFIKNDIDKLLTKQ
jgi:peroxiredoxin